MAARLLAQANQALKYCYLPGDAVARNTMAGTGVAGQYMERGFCGIAGAMLAAPVAVVVAESSACGVVVTGLRATGTQILKQFTWKAFRTKVGSDFAVQFGGGIVKNDGDMLRSISEVNITSLLTAWLLPSAGLGGSVRNAVIKSTARLTVSVTKNAPPEILFKSPQLNSMEGFGNYLTAIGLDVVGDRLKSNLIKGSAPVWARSMAALRQSGSALGQWIAANRIALGLSGQIATSLAIKMAKDKEKDRMAERLKPTPPTPLRP